MLGKIGYFLQKGMLLKMLLGGIIFVLSFVIGNTYAQDGTKVSPKDDMTSAEYEIRLGDFDPISRPAAIPTTDEEKERIIHTNWKQYFYGIMEKISNFLLTLIPIIGGMALIIAGYFYMFSASESDRISKAKTIIIYNLFAILVAFSSAIIIQIIAKFFS